MAHESRRQLAEVFRIASELPAADRAAYLDGEYAGEPELRRQIEDLLAHDEARDNLLERPAWENITIRDPVAFLEEPAVTTGRGRLAPGVKLGPYLVDEPIGAGGMGEVFRATDRRLHRTVAIKVLPVEKFSDPDHQRRFLRRPASFRP
jgi:hypothetical protein